MSNITNTASSTSRNPCSCSLCPAHDPAVTPAWSPQDYVKALDRAAKDSVLFRDLCDECREEVEEWRSLPKEAPSILDADWYGD